MHLVLYIRPLCGEMLFEIEHHDIEGFEARYKISAPPLKKGFKIECYPDTTVKKVTLSFVNSEGERSEYALYPHNNDEARSATEVPYNCTGCEVTFDYEVETEVKSAKIFMDVLYSESEITYTVMKHTYKDDEFISSCEVLPERMCYPWDCHNPEDKRPAKRGKRSTRFPGATSD